MEPDEENIPIEFVDLSLQTQGTILVYSHLKDDWDYMNGTFLGKNTSNMEFILNLLDISKSNWLLTVEMINYIDNIRQKEINSKKKAK